MQRIGQIKMLAHYTSIDVLASMLRTNELWLSSAREMNDIEEVTGATATIAAALEKFGPQVFQSVPFAPTMVLLSVDAIRGKYGGHHGHISG